MHVKDYAHELVKLRRATLMKKEGEAPYYQLEFNLCVKDHVYIQYGFACRIVVNETQYGYLSEDGILTLEGITMLNQYVKNVLMNALTDFLTGKIKQ